MSDNRTRVIVNPAAGANATYRRWPRIKGRLERAGLVFEHTFTEAAGHAMELARNAVGDGFRRLVAVGGDGTVNEVANGILHSGSADNTCLGIISTGTGSDFVRSAGISPHFDIACSSVNSERRLLIDVGLVECMKGGQTVKRYFVNTAGLGFDAAVSEATNRLSKRFGGTLPYLAGLARTLAGYRNRNITLETDGRSESARVLSVVVNNGKYFGGGMKISPEASLDDGRLDLVVIGDVTKLDLLKSLPMIYKGTHGNHPKVSMGTASSVSVECETQTPVHADGEVVGEGPASFSILPGALNLII